MILHITRAKRTSERSAVCPGSEVYGAGGRNEKVRLNTNSTRVYKFPLSTADFERLNSKEQMKDVLDADIERGFAAKSLGFPLPFSIKNYHTPFKN